MKFRFDHMDAAESAFFSRQLEHIRPATLDIKFPNLLARQLVPVDSSVGNGAETYTYRTYTHTGIAAWMRDYSTGLPRSDVQGAEYTSKIRSFGSSYGYSFQEGRAAMQGKFDLEQRKANAARRACEEFLESVVRTGSSADGMYGLLNQPNATTYSTPNGASGSKLWSQKTSLEILADLNGVPNSIPVATKNIETADTMLMPQSSYDLIATKPMGDGNSETVLSYFLKTNPYIKTIVPWYALETAGDSSTRRLVVYKRDPDHIFLVLPQDFEQFPPQYVNLEVVTNCHMRVGGVVCPYPLAMVYADGI